MHTTVDILPSLSEQTWGHAVLYGCGRFANMAETLVAQARRVPTRIAVCYGDRELSYAELDSESNQVARILEKHLGVRPGSRVCYLLPNGIDQVVVYYAIQKLGAIAVPVPYRFIPREIAFVLESCEANALICDDERGVDVDEAVEGGLRELGGWLSTGVLMGLAALEDSSPIVIPHNLGLVSRIQYTGGSTGVPKGAKRTQFADLAECASVLGSNGLGIRDDNVVLIQSPLEHHGGHSWLIATIAAGATLVLCGKFDPGVILRAIEDKRVTYLLVLPPTSYIRLLSSPLAKQFDLTSVRLVQSAAGAMTRKAIDMMFEAFPNATINYGWGQSESGSGTSIAITRELLSNGRLLQSIGTPMPGLELKIVDDMGKEVPCGIPGEAMVRCPAVMSGYWGQPALTDAMFEKGWLRTGDIMVQDQDGYYYLVSRKKNVIKSGGENVFAAEVERAILSCPGVRDCVVYGVADPVMGEAVAATVECEPNVVLTGKQVQEWCRGLLASYKKPRYIAFVDQLSRNDAGKITHVPSGSALPVE